MTLPDMDTIWRKDILRSHEGEVIPIYTSFEQEVLVGGERRRRALDRQYEDERLRHGPHWTEPDDYKQRRAQEDVARRLTDPIIEQMRAWSSMPGLTVALHASGADKAQSLTLEQEAEQLSEEIDAIEKAQEQRKLRLKKLEELLKAQWAEKGITKMTLANGTMLSLKKDAWARKPKEVEDSVLESALKLAGLEQYVAHPLTLKVRELSALNREIGKEWITEKGGKRRKTLMDEYPVLKGVVELSEGGYELQYTRPRTNQKEDTYSVPIESLDTEDR